MDVNLKLVCVATDRTPELNRFEESATYWGYDYVILGLDREWVSGQAENGRLVYPGGGMKVNLLKDYLNSFTDTSTLILFTDSYDVVFNQGPEELVQKYRNIYGDAIVFTAEKTCWPDDSLSSLYPDSKYDYKYLNSGGFIGSVEQLRQLTISDCDDSDDDQLYYTLKFLNGEGVVLDYNLELFQTLNISESDIMVSKSGLVYNKYTSSRPSVIHANGGIGPRTFLNRLYDKMPKHEKEGVEYTNQKILINLYFDRDVENIYSVLTCLKNMDLRRGVSVSIYNNSAYNDWFIRDYVKQENRFLVSYTYDSGMGSYQMRNTSFTDAKLFDYVMMWDGNFKLKNVNTLSLLISEDRDIISPMINTEKTLNSNFYMGITHDGYFKPHKEYMSVRSYEDMGVHTVPFISGVILCKGWLFNNIITPSFYDDVINDEFYADDDFGIVFCNKLREKNILMSLTNKNYFGKTM